MLRKMTLLLCATMLAFGSLGCGAKTGGDAPLSSALPQLAESSVSAESSSPPVPSPPKPDLDWVFDTPENHGVDSEILRSLHEAVADTEIYAIVVAKDGYIINEYYKQGYDANSLFRLYSCTKSISSALIGIAIEQGLISGVSTPLTAYFPHLADEPDARKREITLAQLLSHTSGIRWAEWNGGTMFRQLVQAENRVAFVLSQPMAAAPGTVFNYTTGGSHLLSAIIQEATKEDTFAFVQKNLLKPLGITRIAWSRDPQGILDGGNGVSLTVRDAAKFGQLYLDGGRWKGNQIIPEAWVAESTTVQAAGAASSGQYGYQWWLKTFGKSKAYQTYYAMGHAGQFIFVVPELQLIAVITSHYPQNTYAPWPFFTDYILEACG